MDLFEKILKKYGNMLRNACVEKKNRIKCLRGGEVLSCFTYQQINDSQNHSDD